VVLYIPWIPNVRGKALAVIGQLYPLGLHRVLTDLLRPIPGHPGAPLHSIPTVPGLIVVALCALGGAAWLARAPRPKPGAPSGAAGVPVLLILLALATPFGLLLYSLLGTDIWLPRGLSASMPAAALVLAALLAAWPGRLAAVSTAAVLATLAFGTVRSFEPAYARGPYRAIASYLDRAAAPDDRIFVLSLIGSMAIPEQATRTHRFTQSLAQLWRETAPGAAAFFVLDDAADTILHLGTPHHRGFRLVARRHYAGASATDVVTYRRSS
jgi:hypothetical protein